MASLGTDRASNLRRECSVADQLSAHRVRARSLTRDLDNIPLLRARGRSCCLLFIHTVFTLTRV